jgi:Ca2+-transporting ATPase
MIDPPRKEVKDAIGICKQAASKWSWSQGDHQLTATAVGKDLSLIGDDSQRRVLTGAELENLSDQQLADIVEDVAIYARVSPEQKCV